MKKFTVHPCAAKANNGDEVELQIAGYSNEKHLVIGHFELSAEKMTVPVLGIKRDQRTNLDNYYYTHVVIGFPYHYEFCIPLHENYINTDSIVKIYKKKVLDEKKLAEDKYLAEYDV